MVRSNMTGRWQRRQSAINKTKSTVLFLFQYREEMELVFKVYVDSEETLIRGQRLTCPGLIHPYVP